MSEYIFNYIDKDTLYRNLASTLALRDAYLEYEIPQDKRWPISYTEYVQKAEATYLEEFKYFDLDNVTVLGIKQPQNIVELDKAFRLSGIILSHTITDILTRILNDEIVSIKFNDGRNLRIQKDTNGNISFESRDKTFMIPDMKELQQFVSRICPNITRYGSKPKIGPVVYIIEQLGR